MASHSDDGHIDNDSSVVYVSRIALENRKTARDTVKLIGFLVDKYGYWGTDETLSAEDANEAWSSKWPSYPQTTMGRLGGFGSPVGAGRDGRADTCLSFFGKARHSRRYSRCGKRPYPSAWLTGTDYFRGPTVYMKKPVD
jgi:hypothetical protein